MAGGIVAGLALVCACSAVPSALMAQDAPTAGEPKADKVAKEPESQRIPAARYRDERDGTTDELLAAEFRRRHPEIDIASRHNVNDIKNPADAEERYDYTVKMTRVIDLWIASGNGAALAKVLDGQTEAKDRQLVFLTLSGYFFLNWPPKDSRVSAMAAQKYLDAAVAVDAEFAPAAVYLASYNLKYFGGAKAAEAERLVNMALKKRPGFSEAALLKCSLLDGTGRGAELREHAKQSVGIEGLSALDTSVFLNYYVRAEPDDDAARAYLNELLAKAANPARRAVVMRHLAAVLLRAKRHEDARSLGRDAIALLDRAKDAETVLVLMYSVLDDSLKGQAQAAREAKDAEKEKALNAERERLLLEAFEIDVEHVGPTDTTKAIVLDRMKDFLVLANREADYLKVLTRYDREAKRLTWNMRERIRVEIENMEAIFGIRLPLERLRELARSTNPADHRRLAEAELVPLLLYHADDPSINRFGDEKTLAALLEFAAHQHRGVARRGIRLAAIGAEQSGSAESKATVLRAISARIANEKTVGELEVQSLVQDALSALIALGGRDGAVLVGEWIGNLGDALAGSLTVRSEARAFAEKAVDAAGLKADRALWDAAGSIRTAADAAAFAKSLKEKVEAAKAAEAAAKPADSGGKPVDSGAKPVDSGTKPEGDGKPGG